MFHGKHDGETQCAALLALMDTSHYRSSTWARTQLGPFREPIHTMFHEKHDGETVLSAVSGIDARETPMFHKKHDGETYE